MAHFIDALKKESENIDPKNLIDLDKAASRAATRVRKFNIDYGDLTDVEKKVFKRVVPFYTWMRKNIPLQIEAMALTPGRQAVVPKGLRALNNIMGGDEDGEYPKIGGLDTVPKWLRDMGAVQILGEGQGRNGVFLDPSVLAPSLSAMDVLDEPAAALIQGDVEGALSSGSSELLNMLNPYLRTGVEFGTDTNTFTGGKREPGLGGYFQDIIPISRLASKAATGELNEWDVANYATGASFREIGEPQVAGELRRQQDMYEGALQRSGGRAAEMLRGRDISTLYPETDMSDPMDVAEAKARLNSEIADLEAGGRSLSLLEQSERFQKHLKNTRVQKILESYADYNNQNYQAFISV